MSLLRSKRLRKAVGIIVGLCCIGVLFVRSLRSSRSEPYRLPGDRLAGWTVTIEPPDSPSGAVLTLRPPAGRPDLGLFGQVFARTMETLSEPDAPAIPLILNSEFEQALGARLTRESLAAVARRAGLESETLLPHCLAFRRISRPGVTQQLFFVLFDSPAFVRFRQQIATQLQNGAGGLVHFDPMGVSPVLFVAASDHGFRNWLPLVARPDADCLAPVSLLPVSLLPAAP